GDGGSRGRVHRRVGREVATEDGIRGGDRVDRLAERHHQVADGGVGVHLAGAVGRPALQDRAVRRRQPAEAVEREGAGAGVELLTLLADDEEAVAGDGQVARAPRVLGGALGEGGRYAPDANAEADLRRVGAAVAGRARG